MIGGLRTKFGIFLTDSESDVVRNYLDSDGSGDISFQEFVSKVNFKDYQQKQNYLTISKVTFMNTILEEWQISKERDREKVATIFKKFDDNGDGVLVLDEFETLLKSLEPNLKKK